MARNPKRPKLTHCKLTKTANPRAPWRLWFTVERDGRAVRKFRSFASEDAAWRAAEEKDIELANHGVRYGDMPPEARRAYDYFRDQAAELAEAGAEVPSFETLVAEALAAIRATHAAREESALTVAEAVATFVAYKETRVKKRQIADLRDRLKRFAETFGARPLRSVTTPEAEAWLANLRSRRNPSKLPQAPLLGPLTRNHYRAAMHALYAYACAPGRGWAETNPVAAIEPEAVETGEPQAYAPEDAAKLMQAALDHRPELVPVLTLGMFCGLRVSEAIGTDLAKLPREPGEFRTTGKTGPRMAPLTEAAAAWLAAQPRRKGKAWHKGPRQLVDDMQELFKLAKVEAIDNGARHSFITFRTAETRDVARVADEAGNSVSTIKNHYRQLVTAEAAERFFSIRPEAPAANVTNIQRGRASA